MSTNAFLFDIDGVIYRGGKVLPMARTALLKIYDQNLSKFTHPVCFLTNGDDSTCKEKAEKLTNMLINPDNNEKDLIIPESSIILANTPIKTQQSVHEKFTLVLGCPSRVPGSFERQLDDIGITNYITVDQIHEKMPYLNPWSKNKSSGYEKPKENGENQNQNILFPKIEQILIIGLCQNWNLNLRILLDCLFTDGDFWQRHDNNYHETNGVRNYENNKTNLPLYVCNLDLEYVDSAPGPRFSNGSFILCLETLYEKTTGKKLIISDICGKPSEMTYKYAIEKLKEQQEQIIQDSISDEKSESTSNKGKIPHLQIYGIGDNVQSDIMGANMAKKFENFKSILLCTGCYLKPNNNLTFDEMNELQFRENLAKSVNINHAPSFLLERDLSDRDNCWKLYIPDMIFDDVLQFMENIF